MTKAAIDIGNSRIKLSKNDDFFAFDYSDRWEDSVLSKVLNSGPSAIIAYCSVNPRATEKLLTASRLLESKNNCSIKILDAIELLQKNPPVDYSQITGSGSDRILGLCGGLNLEVEPPFITIDCGTAITINVLDKNSVFLGGLILPGFETQREALNSTTRQINTACLQRNNSIIGKNTESAVGSGIINSTSLGLIGVYHKICREYFAGEPIQLILSGGGKEYLSIELGAQRIGFLKRESLVLDGVIYCLNQYLQKNGNS